MRLAPRTRRTTASLGALSVAALVLSGCGGSTTTAATKTAAPSVKSVAAIAALVPADVRARGTIIIGTDATYAPMEFMDTDGKTIIGMEPDLGVAIGNVLGMKVKHTNGTFDTLIPGLSSGKYDIAMSSMNDTKEREEKLDFVTLWQAGSSFVTKATGGPSVKALADLCGLKVAVLSGSVQQGDVAKQTTACVTAGKPKPVTSVFSDVSKTFLALSSGRVEVVVAGGVGNAYAVDKSEGKFIISGPSYDEVKTGIAVPKGTSMAKAVQGAVNELIANGEYAKILEKWGSTGLKITKSEINVAASQSS
jgi:polar amino acid transport system substrate-binding protein